MSLRSLLGWAGALLLAATFSLAGAVLITAATERGSRWSVEQAVEFLPALEVGRVSGSWLRGLHLSRLQWQSPSGSVNVEDVALKLHLLPLLGGRLSIEHLHASSATVVLAPGEASAPKAISLPSVAMPLQLVLHQLSLSELRIEGLDEPLTLRQIALRGKWRGERLQINNAGVAWPQGSAALRGELLLRDNYPLSLTLELESPALEGKLVAQLQGSVETLRIDARSSGRWPLQATAVLQPLEPTLPFRLEVNTREAVNVDAAPLDIEDGFIRMQGDLQGARGEAKLLTRLPRLGTGELAAQLAWQPDQLSLKQLHWTRPDGATPLSADCDLQPQTRTWRCGGQLQDLALDELLPVPQARLSSPFNLSGTFNDGLTLDLAIPSINGNLAGEPLQGNLRIHTDNANEWHIDKLQLQAGRGKVQAHGALGPRNTLQISADLPDLALFNAALGGQLTFQGNLAGSLETPYVVADFSVDGPRFQTWRARKLSGNIDIRRAGRARSTLRLDLARLRNEEQGLPDLSVSVQAAGDRANTDWQLQASEPRGSQLHAKCHGHTDNPLSRLSLRCSRLVGELVTPQRTIALALPDALLVAYELENRRLALSPFCLRADKASLCLREAFVMTPETLSPLIAEFTGLPVDWLADYAPRRAPPLDGTGINGELQVSQWQPLTAHARLGLDELSWPWQASAQAPEMAHLTNIHAVAVANGERVELRAGAQSATLGQLSLEAQIHDPLAQRKLTGTAAIEGLQLDAFSWLYPEDYRVSGRMDAQLTLSGVVSAPRADGRVRLIGDRLELPGLNQALHDIRLDAELHPDSALFNATFGLGAGTGTLQGRLDLPPQWEQWKLRADLRTEQIELAPLPESTLTLSSELSLVANGESARINGSIDVLRAAIRLQKLPPDVERVSADVEIVGSAEQAGPALHADVKVRLGDQFRFSGLGAQVRLAGQLRLRHDPARGLSARGEVKIPSGRYFAYGQRLAVRRGSFLFAGALENPDIDLEAVRELPPDIKVVAGLHVNGPLRSPTLSLFSDPPMSETDTAYYLLTGRPPPESGDASRAGAQSAILNLGLAGATAPISKVAERVGITDLQVSATATEEAYQSQVSGYLSPRLYLRYASGLGDQGGSLTFQYRLTEQLILEAVSGVDQALDLLYTFHIR